MKADFHVHTTISDCSDSPEEVFKQAKANGVTHIAITDHDTMYGQTIHKALAAKYGIKYIPGIEISAFDYERGNKCHIIGLNVQPGHHFLDQMIAQVTRDRHDNSEWQIKKLMDLGYELEASDFEHIRGHHGVYKQHIMDVLIRKNHADEFFGSFYNKMFKGKGPLNLKVEYPSHIDVTKALAESGAIPVLAHPTVYDNMDAVEELVEVGLKGIEAYYPAASAEDTINIEMVAKKYDLILSGGSDYHGKYAGHNDGYVGSHFVMAFEGIL